jgi:hypothetical protein
MNFDAGQYTTDCCTAAHELKITIHELKQLQHKLEIAIEALRNIVELGGISRITAEEALREIEEVE